MRTRWLAPVQAVGPVDSGQCAEFRPIEFRLRGSEVETFRADLGAQAVTCLINRTGASIPYARSWNGVDWHNDVVEDRHRRWSSSEAGRVLRVRLPDRIGAPVSEGSVHELESRMSAEAADCDDGVMYVLRRDGDRIDVTRLP